MERRRPGGSLPPRNFVPDFETQHYRVWRRQGPSPRAHLALGADDLDGAEALDCGDRDVRQFMRAAAGGEVDVSLPRTRPRVVVPSENWVITEAGRVAAPPGQIVARRGYAGGAAKLPPGRYRAWIQGSVGGLLRLRVDQRTVADVYADLGLPDAWQPLGSFESSGQRLRFEAILLDRNELFAGDRHASILGPLVVEPENAEPRIERLPAERARRHVRRAGRLARDPRVTQLAAWVAFPLAAVLISSGLGLLVERSRRARAAQRRCCPALGFCAGVALVGPVYAAHAGAELALGVLAVAALAGYALARHDLRTRLRPGLGAAAGLAVYALYMLPVIATGKATFLGYNLLNDTAIHLALVDYLDDWGRRDPSSSRTAASARRCRATWASPTRWAATS